MQDSNLFIQLFREVKHVHAQSERPGL
jgi:hypothetical protein